jgi:hypothetical protein
VYPEGWKKGVSFRQRDALAESMERLMAVRPTTRNAEDHRTARRKKDASLAPERSSKPEHGSDTKSWTWSLPIEDKPLWQKNNVADEIRQGPMRRRR